MGALADTYEKKFLVTVKYDQNPPEAGDIELSLDQEFGSGFNRIKFEVTEL